MARDKTNFRLRQSVERSPCYGWFGTSQTTFLTNRSFSSGLQGLCLGCKLCIEHNYILKIPNHKRWIKAGCAFIYVECRKHLYILECNFRPKMVRERRHLKYVNWKSTLVIPHFQCLRKKTNVAYKIIFRFPKSKQRTKTCSDTQRRIMVANLTCLMQKKPYLNSTVYIFLQWNK